MSSDTYSAACEEAVIEITNACNLRCPHCASTSGRARADEMTLAELQGVIRDLASLGCREVTLLGGEFVLRRDWPEVARAVKDAGMILQIITNGLLVSDAVRAQLRELAPFGLGVSIDGATRESYRKMRGVDGFETCLRLLDAFVADGVPRVNAITTFNAKNLTDFDRFTELFIDKPYNWQIQMAHRGGERFPEDLLMTREQYAWLVDRATPWLTAEKERLRLVVMDDFGYFPMAPKLRTRCSYWGGCAAGTRIIGIRANGDLLPCLSLGDAFVEGNLRKRSLVEIWRDPKSFPRFRNKSSELTGRCSGCPHASVCKVGCSAMAFSQTGTLTETTFCVRQLEQDRILQKMALGTP